MSDVSCVCCAPLVAEVRRRGLPVETLAAGLGVPLATFEDLRQRVPWDAFTVFAHRASELLGGGEHVEEVAARSALESVPGLVRRLLPVLGRVRLVYYVGVRWWGPWVFRGTRATCEELPDGRLREVVEILPGHPPCPELFEGLRGILRAMPRLFGQPDAVVELLHDGRRGEFLIALPPRAHGARERVARRWRALRRATLGTPELASYLPEDLEELGFAQEQLRETERRSEVARALLADTSRRLDAVGRLGRALVRHGEVPGRVEALVRLLEAQFPVQAVRLQRMTPEGSLVRLAESGEPSGAADVSRELQVAGRTVGRLELFGFDAGANGSAKDLLEELLPWMALALESAGSQSTVEGLTRLLQLEVGEWQRVGRRLERLAEERAVEEEAAVAPTEAWPGEPRRLAPEWPEPAEQPEPPDRPERPPETILLVERDERLRARGRHTLEDGGYRVLEARSSSEALRLCHELPEPVHLLVTDLASPSLDPGVSLRAMRRRPELRGMLMLRLRRP